MKRIIIGTAGHVDHGKTTLIEALTGIDCDRWDEEKQRGITLDLGFAHLTDDEVQLSFVDVPGHERFLHNALAGLGGIGAVLLVIDAGEGVRAQTEEHVDIIRLLGIDRIIVALTKVDSVEDDWLELVAAEVGDFLNQRGFVDPPIHRISATEGTGLDDLLDELRRCANETGTTTFVPLRLPVDRAFQITGRGTVVTGSPARGSLSDGDELAINGGSTKVRVRRLEVHGRERSGAGVGERVAAQLAGANPDDVPRGTQLVTPGAFVLSRSFAARLTLLPGAATVESAQDLRLHLFSAELAARIRPLEHPIRPGESGWVEGVIARRTVLAVGDRTILRRPSPPTTIGGLEIADPVWRRPRGRRLAPALRLLGDGDPGLLCWWARDSRLQGISAEEVARRFGATTGDGTERLQLLADDGRLLRLPKSDRFVDPGLIRELMVQATLDLDDFHRSQPLEPGMAKAEFIDRHLESVDNPQPHLDLLGSVGVLVESKGYVARPDQGETLDEEQHKLAQRLADSLEELEFAVPSAAELARNLNAKVEVVEGLLRYLRRQGRAVKLPSGLWLATATLDRTVADLRNSGWDSFSVGDFKDRYGLSRKWAIPVLEYLDAQKVTARKGDRRVVVR